MSTYLIAVCSVDSHSSRGNELVQELERALFISGWLIVVSFYPYL